MYRRLTAPFLFSLALMLSGCGDSVELHRNISEQEAMQQVTEQNDQRQDVRLQVTAGQVNQRAQRRLDHHVQNHAQ